ncbi:MAG: hypothetical protein SNJ73_09695 [Acetobacteraceae bacterium]
MNNGRTRAPSDVVPASKLPCCPPMEQGPRCDVIDLRYVLPSRTVVRDRVVPVELIFHYRLERCSEGLVVGDLAYTTTLLPGEQVRLFTSNRHTRWSYDASSAQTYRHETTSEESYLTWGIARAMSELNVSRSGSGSSSVSESWAQGGGGASVNLFGLIQIGGGGGGGSYDAASAYQFNRQLSQHAASASARVAAGVRASSTTSVGEVETRQHAEGQSQERIESSSRVFANHNRCHAVTYLFHHLMKRQRIRLRLVAIQRVVEDPAAPTLVDERPAAAPATGVTVKPQQVFATAKERLELERGARLSVLEAQRNETQFVATATLLRAGPATPVIDPALRQAALDQSAKDLAAAGMIDAKTGAPTERIVAELSWEREELLPTAGLIVRGCLDECITCEPSRQRLIELEIEQKALENKLLARRIELLEKAQEYRCCPAGEDED